MVKTSTMLQVEIIANEAIKPLRNSTLNIFRTIRQATRIADVSSRALYYLWHELSESGDTLCVRCYEDETKYIQIRADIVDTTKVFGFRKVQVGE
jgi:hypothetical protein